VPSYNNDPNPVHGYASDAERYARMGWGHAPTESWSQAEALRVMIDTARSVEVTRQHESTRVRNGTTIRRLLIAVVLALVAVMSAVGTDAAVRAGVGDLNHAPTIVRLAPAHVACVVHAARKC
jgi:hypothetical protein